MNRDDLFPVWNPILEEIEGILSNAGIYYRAFARGKSTSSIKRKLTEKGEEYRSENKKLQDIIGIRIILYFPDDVPIIRKYLIDNFDKFDNESNSDKDIAAAKTNQKFLSDLTDKIFMPSRLNLVFRMREEHAQLLNSYLYGKSGEYDISLIDTSYEIQLRTVLSEGWHEVEHDLRYKTKDEPWWDYCSAESRILNGIMASLETSEWSLQQIYENIAYKNYRKMQWDAMLKAHYRIRFIEAPLSADLNSILSDNDGKLAKECFRYNRVKLIKQILRFPFHFDLTTDNIVFLVNALEMHDERITELTPPFYLEKFKSLQ